MYAAVGLTRMNRTNDVLNRAKRDLESPNALNASQAAQLQSVLKTLSASNDKAIRQDVSAALGRLSSRMDNLAQARSLKEAHDLQRDFASMRVTESIWKPYPGPGGELWLVGRTPKGAASLPLAVVVRAEAVRRSVETDRSGHGGTAFRITTGGETGESLGDRLHELKVELPPEAGATAAADSGLRQSFYGLSLFVVVPLTFLGGYLLWRDMVAPADWPKIVTLFGSPGPGVRSCPMNDDRIPGSNHNARYRGCLIGNSSSRRQRSSQCEIGGPRRLRANSRKPICSENAIPVLYRCRWPPAKWAQRWRGERNTLKYSNTGVVFTGHA